MGSRFLGKVAVVTGAGRGIGRGVALLLAEEGASVVVNDLGCEVDGSGSSKLPADRVVDEIMSRGGTAVASYDDVSSMNGGESVVDTALDNYGRLDALVNSVGVLKDAPVHRMAYAQFDRVVRSTVKGTFAPTKYAAILFRQQRSGRIVNMTSDAGLGDIGRANYAAASEAIIGLTRTVARDMGRYGVTCNAISPTATTRLFPNTEGNHRAPHFQGPTASQREGAGEVSTMLEWAAPGGRTTRRTWRHWRSSSAQTLSRMSTATFSECVEAAYPCTRIRPSREVCTSGVTSLWKRWTPWRPDWWGQALAVPSLMSRE